MAISENVSPRFWGAMEERDIPGIRDLGGARGTHDPVEPTRREKKQNTRHRE